MATTALQKLILAAMLALCFSGATQAWENVGAGPVAQDDDSWEDDDWEEGWEEDWSEEEASPWHGFVELAGGMRFGDDPAVGRRATLGEFRTRLERTWEIGNARIDFRGDALYDAVLDDLDAGLRELAINFPAGKADVSIGRQILTWGTGDLLFLNDLFPKGWVSFFIGRDDEYLKAPSDAIRFTWYGSTLNIDLAAMPRFHSDEFLTGERLSFFSPMAGGIVAPVPPLAAAEPSAGLSNTEWALRLFRNAGSNELALYGYSGFYHQPAPAGPGNELVYPEMDAWGASWRRPLGAGLFNTEFSRYFSKDDRSGSDPRIPNDQYRFLIGYEWEAVSNLTVGFQYYLEWTLDHDALIANSPWPQYEVEERRTWLTNRLTWRTRQDRVIWSIFSFYSPTDKDYYLRPQMNWRISDELLLSAGGNLFGGDEKHTFFAQFEDNSNYYIRLRFHF
jgi:hypothetical protein